MPFYFPHHTGRFISSRISTLFLFPEVIPASISSSIPFYFFHFLFYTLYFDRVLLILTLVSCSVPQPWCLTLSFLFSRNAFVWYISKMNPNCLIYHSLGTKNSLKERHIFLNWTISPPNRNFFWAPSLLILTQFFIMREVCNIVSMFDVSDKSFSENSLQFIF